MFDGIWPGIVVDNADPKMAGRIKVRAPQVYGPEELAEKIPGEAIPWALPCFPCVGKNSGIVFVPEIGAGVWLMFVGGDARYPVWLGGWLADADVVSEHKIGYTPQPKSYVIKTPLRRLIVMSDEQFGGITIDDGYGESYTMSSATGSIAEVAAETKALSAKSVLVTAAVSVVIVTALLSITAATISVIVSGAVSIAAISFVAGNILAAQKLCNKAMLDLFNSHTHLYLPGSGSPTPTLPPQQTGTEDVHTTKDSRMS